MSKRRKQINFLSVSQGGDSSRFVVDLKKQIEEKQEKEPDKTFWLQIKSWLFTWQKKLFALFAQTQDKQSLAETDNSGQSLLVKISSQINKINIKEESKEVKRQYSFFIKKTNFDKLAFYSLVKLIICALIKAVTWFYVLCYGIGWLTIFFLRFFWFIFLALVKLLSKVYKKLAPKIFYLIKLCVDGLVIGFKRVWANVKLIAKEANKLGKQGKRWFVMAAKMIEHTLKQAHKAVKPAWSYLARIRVWGLWGNKRRYVAGDFVVSAQPNETPASTAPTAPTNFSMIRSALVFTAILFILVLPFKAFTYYKSLDSAQGQILGASEEGINELLSASESIQQLDFSQARESFEQAGANFLSAQVELDEINNLLLKLTAIIPSEEMRLAANAPYILSAGQAASSLGSNLSLILDSLFNNQDDLWLILDQITRYGDQAVASAQSLKKQLDYIDIHVLPEEYRLPFSKIRDKATMVAESLSEFINLAKGAHTFLGAQQDKRYLLVFQNNAEMRGSGGFVGSFAIIDFSQGKIKNIEVPGGGSYDTRAGLDEKILPPEPLQLLGVHWRFWDANWWPDWPKSAQKLAWFYERSDGSTVDGVIGFTPTVMERLLEVIGPIGMEEKYGLVIDSQNFWLTVQEIVEEKITGIKEPKQIISDLMTKIIEELPGRLNKENLINLLGAVEQSLEEKHILFYFTQKEMQEKVDDMDWSGRMKQTSKDYLAVINTNIAGGKSDRKIKESILHKAEVMPDGSVINEVKITRYHTGSKGERYVGVRNVDWMRIYVPLGSELQEAQGFEKPDDIYFKQPEEGWCQDPDLIVEENLAETDQESGTKIYNEAYHTVFANWSMVDPGQTITVYLKYKLPFKLEIEKSENLMDKVEDLLNPSQRELIPYTLLVQKQPGAKPSQFKSSFIVDEKYKLVWHYPKELFAKDNGWEIKDDLDTDKYWAILLENKK